VFTADRIAASLRSAGCVFAEEEAALLVETATSPEELVAMVERRANGLPLEQVLGWAEFCGLRLVVAPGVFVPRRRTEFLVRQAEALAHESPAGTAPTVVVDLCCGTGALGVALAEALDHVELYASDIDATAVRCARRNVAGRGVVYQGDLYEPLPTRLRGRVDLLVANTPYVPTDEIELLPTEARVHEPRVALDGGTDGLDVMRRVTAEAALWLAPGGHLLVETSERQAPRALEIIAGCGLRPRLASSDELGATIVIGTRPDS
jgi:release factor glutamine methyltransferase